MNCKQGDLALVIRSNSANIGKFVTCLELLPAGSCNACVEDGPLWRIDRELEWDSTLGKFPGYLVPDWALMPIRPSPERRPSEEANVHSENGHGR
ncbi:MAG TPA: hypothetical protein VN660_01005 [Steroidobacteraceae bacterium]|nr:hypothetical protein [Steroidobacteraceae bacterium]